MAQQQRICLQCRSHKIRGFDPLLGKITWRKASQPTPVFLPGESHGQRSLRGYCPWDGEESDTTEETGCTHISPQASHRREHSRGGGCLQRDRFLNLIQLHLNK